MNFGELLSISFWAFMPLLWLLWLLLLHLFNRDPPQTPLDRIEGKLIRLIHPCGRQAALPGHASAQGRR